MNRRNFLKTSSVLVSGSFFSQFFPFGLAKAIAQTATAEDHFFVLLQVEGGMDVTLGLDPRTHGDGSDQNDVFLEYSEQDIIQAGNIRLGPAAESLKNYYNDLLIVNGINMRRDAGHEALRDYMASGSGDGKTALLPIEIAATTQVGPMGLLINNSVAAGKRRLVMTHTRELSNVSDANGELMQLIDLASSNSGASFMQAVSGLISAQQPLETLAASLKKYKETNGELQDGKKDSVIAALSFQSGLSRQAILRVTNNNNPIDLDTHSNHEGRHLASQKSVWDSVAETFSVFKSIEYKTSTLFDHTTFMVQTEFSRTPFLNNSRGKDHNPYTNSILLAGKGINGNQVIGGSHVIKKSESRLGIAQHISTPLDYSTGALIHKRENATNNVGLIFPENVARTVAKIFGDPSDFSSVSLDGTKVIPGIVKA